MATATRAPATQRYADHDRKPDWHVQRRIAHFARHVGHRLDRDIANNPFAYSVSASYASSASIPLTIADPVPTLSVTDAGGTYNGSIFPAISLVNGGSSLEGVTPTLAYCSGSSATGTASRRSERGRNLFRRGQLRRQHGLEQRTFDADNVHHRCKPRRPPPSMMSAGRTPALLSQPRRW